MTDFYRNQVVLNTQTLEFGTVQTDPFPGFPRARVPVVLNPARFAGKPGQQSKLMPADDLLSLGFEWGAAWRKLSELRDSGEYALTDSRIPSYSDLPQPAQITRVRFDKARSLYFAQATHGNVVHELHFPENAAREMQALNYPVEGWLNVPGGVRLDTFERINVAIGWDGNGWSLVGLLPRRSIDITKYSPLRTRILRLQDYQPQPAEAIEALESEEVVYS